MKGKKITVGVTADENDDIQKAMDKMVRKNLDMMIINTISGDSIRYMENITIIKDNYSVQPLPSIKSREEKTKYIMEAIAFASQENQATETLLGGDRSHSGTHNSMQAWL